MEVRMVGAGGIAHWLWESLFRYLLSLDEQSNVVIIDGDDIEPGNLTRQFFPNDLGKSKAEVLAQRAVEQFDLSGKITVRAVGQYLNNETVKAHRVSWIGNGYLFLGCVDNDRSRVFLEDEVFRLRNFIYVTGGNDDTEGQAIGCAKRLGRRVLPRISEVAPEILDDEGPLPGEGCLESGPQTVLANKGVALAMEVLVHHLLEERNPKFNEIRVDLKTAKMMPRMSKAIGRKKKRRSNGTHQAKNQSRSRSRRRHERVR